MKKIAFIASLLLLISCTTEQPKIEVNNANWEEKRISLTTDSSLFVGSSYLSVYSEVYSKTEKRTHNLTVTVSMRNTSSTDSVFIKNANYYNTKGFLIREYIKAPIFILPLETVEIVINENDVQGGTGANFTFDWATRNENIEPLFEAVMISTSGQQGISFITQGTRI
ncbi:MAG: DUF3124 domain-containing protein [Flavobacteriales bacterium]|nr:DUF3124 domain-containing protein [Flavobacteriales bacterium]MCB9175286.1 DUF3124 domain-containing protein [Flavobacteriales bacterium]